MEASSPRESLRKQLFAGALDKRSCHILAKDPAATISVDADISSTVKSIIKAINDRDDKTLKDYFNPRLKVSTGQILSALASIKSITGGNATAINYRVLALNSPDGASDGIECEDTGVLVHPLYGYPLTMPVWLQVTGQDDIARVFMELVPSKTNWTIGAWHVQQWTHAGKDFGIWFEEARTLSNKGNKFAAWINADIAVKLLDGGGFLQFPVQKDADDWKLKLMSANDFTAAVKNSFKTDEVRYVSTMFAKTGAGILIRFGIKAEMSSVAIRDHCKGKLKTALTLDWGKNIEGIHCAYIFPREDSKQDGVLGGIYMSKTDIK